MLIIADNYRGRKHNDCVRVATSGGGKLGVERQNAWHQRRRFHVLPAGPTRRSSWHVPGVPRFETARSRLHRTSTGDRQRPSRQLEGQCCPSAFLVPLRPSG